MARIVVIGAGWRADRERSECVSARGGVEPVKKRCGATFSAELLKRNGY